MSEDRPNILVVILDAMRASDFPGGTDPVHGMPFVESLQKESWVFPNAVSPATWTIPSHTSLLTGKYPWEHGTHGFGSLKFGASTPRIPTMLRELGYRTALFSANGFLSEPYGFTDGFDHAVWGGWWEQRLRLKSDSPPYQLEGEGAQATGAMAKRMDSMRLTTGNPLQRVTDQLSRFPFSMDATGRIVEKLRHPEKPWDLKSCPWIEPAFEEYVSKLPPEVPFFGLINFLDVHEPYFPEPSEVHGLADWWRHLRVRQDDVNTLEGRWRPAPAELATLRLMYRARVRGLDGRIQKLVEGLRRTGRWENTWLFVTSDHGQQFGEGGGLFHVYGTSEGLVRIPLWVRPAGNMGAGQIGRGQASLVDIAPTIMSAAGALGSMVASGVDLRELVAEERGTPVMTLSDGLVWEHTQRWVRPSHLPAFMKPKVVSYHDHWKVICEEGTSRTVVVDLHKDGPEGEEISGAVPNEAASSCEAARYALAQVRSPPTLASPSVEERLRAWGYV